MPRRTVPMALYLKSSKATRDSRAVSPTPHHTANSTEEEQEHFEESDLVQQDSKSVSQAVRAGKPRAFEMTDAPHLSEAQVTEFREAFAMFDKDGDGSISVAELGHVMRSLGQNPTDHELTEMIREADDDDNGSVDFEEFLLLMSKKMSMLDIDQELLEAFSVFDKDGNGFIDQDELTNVLASLGEELDEEQVKEMMRQADKDGDGLVSFEEFKDIMCSKV
ncbi:calmodulin-beta-like isoform X3 [Bolinopsis microptera]|uniref:calmodulin-beta-like isoform X3 n=1 Tax=Bolinopsis microptera TaxID=2820187 RepID=UPI0030797DEA